MNDFTVFLLQIVSDLSGNSRLLLLFLKIDFQGVEIQLDGIDAALGPTCDRLHMFLAFFDALFQVVHLGAIL